MKNIKFIVTSFLIAAFALSCETDGGTSKLDLIEGAVPNITKNTELGEIIDFYKLEDDEPITIGFSVDVFYGNVSSADIIGFYRTIDGDLFGPVTLQAGVTQFPAEITMTVEDIIGAFSELTNRSDVQVGDELIVTTKFYLPDGREINMINNDGTRNYGSDIHTSGSYNAQVSYPVSCPSDLAGTYQVVSNGTSTDPGTPPAVNLPYTITLSDQGGGTYKISDGVAGVYIYWYTKYGYTFETPGTFTDVCGNLSGSWVESFGCEIVLEGVINDDGTLSIKWDNCFGDSAEALYTPQ